MLASSICARESSADGVFARVLCDMAGRSQKEGQIATLRSHLVEVGSLWDSSQQLNFMFGAQCHSISEYWSYDRSRPNEHDSSFLAYESCHSGFHYSHILSMDCSEFCRRMLVTSALQTVSRTL